MTTVQVYVLKSLGVILLCVWWFVIPGGVAIAIVWAIGELRDPIAWVLSAMAVALYVWHFPFRYHKRAAAWLKGHKARALRDPTSRSAFAAHAPDETWGGPGST